MSDSISLVVLRFEVADDKEQLAFLNYTAPDFTLSREEISSKSSQRKSYAAVASTSKQPEEAVVDLNTECQGSRKFSHIVIESYYNELTDMNRISEATTSLEKLQMSDCDRFASRSTKRTLVEDCGSARSSREGSESECASASGSVTRSSQKDVYFKPIRDEDDEGPGPAPGPGPSATPRPGSGRPKSHSPTSPTIHFFSGNPMVERLQGILHLYKDSQITPLKGDHSRSELICMIAVPAAYVVHDLMKFLAPVSEGIHYLRIIRDSTPNQYMVLIKFMNQALADEFFLNYNNTPYNSIEPDICHLVYVAKVESMKESEGASLPTPGITELPCCPVCLERMDESVDGVLTILCNHAFHMKCLEQCVDTSCPVCRYCQTPEGVADNRCMKCGSQESLWICLICGHVGCGRYVELHAYKHFQETNHTYAMQLGNNRVWDYVGDNYVHRLIQAKGDGKLVQIDEGGSTAHEEKIDSLNLEYTYLLTNQLESQRRYFEEKMEQLESDVHNETRQLEIRLQTKCSDVKELENRLDSLHKEKVGYEKKFNNLHTRQTKILKDLQEERELNKCLLQNQEEWQKQVKSLKSQIQDLTVNKEQEINELREQLRDVMFYLEAKQKLTSTTEVTQDEIQEGQVVVGASSSPSHKKTRKKDKHK